MVDSHISKDFLFVLRRTITMVYSTYRFEGLEVAEEMRLDDLRYQILSNLGAPLFLQPQRKIKQQQNNK
jgi:hypothetical protein